MVRLAMRMEKKGWHNSNSTNRLHKMMHTVTKLLINAVLVQVLLHISGNATNRELEHPDGLQLRLASRVVLDITEHASSVKSHRIKFIPVTAVIRFPRQFPRVSLRDLLQHRHKVLSIIEAVNFLHRTTTYNWF